MFAELTNESILSFNLRNEGPLLINSGATVKIQPRPDMSFVRTIHNNEETIYLPGSSIKGVFRMRYEQVMRAMGQNVCDTFDSRNNQTCNNKIRTEEKKVHVNDKNEKKRSIGAERYNLCCEACKLFGSLALGGRISFSDAYPIGDWKMNVRNGVGIDRITGSAFPGALYEIETLESGIFSVTCKMTNFKIYQLRTILWVLDDIHQGLVTFGMGGSRGNGQMRIQGDVKLVYRKYGNKAPYINSDDGEISESLFGSQIIITGLEKINAALNINTKNELLAAIKSGVE